jgi:hypothetical protein
MVALVLDQEPQQIVLVVAVVALVLSALMLHPTLVELVVMEQLLFLLGVLLLQLVRMFQELFIMLVVVAVLPTALSVLLV